MGLPVTLGSFISYDFVNCSLGAVVDFIGLQKQTGLFEDKALATAAGVLVLLSCSSKIFNCLPWFQQNVSSKHSFFVCAVVSENLVKETKLNT